MGFTTQWPSFRYMGFGVYYAWIWLCYNSDVLLSDALTADMTNSFITSMYLSSTIALGCVLVVAAVIWRRLRALVESDAFVLGMAAVASVATAGLALVSGGANVYVTYALAVLTGVGTAFTALRLGHLYRQATARDVVMNVAASFVFACLLYFLAIGLPYIADVVFTALLPFVSAFLATLPSATAEEDDVLQADERPADPVVPRSFLARLMFAILAFATIVGIVRGSAAGSVTVDGIVEQGSLIVFSTACVCVLIYFAMGLVRFDVDIDALYYPVILLATAGVLLAPVLGMTNTLQATVVGVAYALFTFVVWCLLSRVARMFGAAYVLVFGLGRGCSALGTSVGWLIGDWLLPAETTSSADIAIVSLVMAFVLVAVALLVFDNRVLGRMLKDMGHHEAAHPSAVQDGGQAAEPAGAVADGAQAGAGGSERPRGGGKWVASCERIATSCQLTARERETLALLAKGFTIKAIAETLCVSFNTAKTHVRHVYVKVGVHSHQELLDLLERTKRELG